MSAVAPAVERPGPGGDWPDTTRLLPWFVAGFIAMLWLVPFDGIELPIPLPIDPKLDRIVLAVLAVVWLLGLVSREETRPRLRRPTGVDVAVVAFVLVALASVLVNVERIAMAGELELATKKLVLVMSLVLFYLIVSTSIRAAELRNLTIFMVALASVTALCIIVEYRTRTNMFKLWTTAVLPGSFLDFRVDGVAPEWGRPQITGPTSHGLAATALMAMALPFAFVGLMDARRRWPKAMYALATILIFAAAMSTLRKTAAIAPAAALLVVTLYRPREALRLLPFGVVVVICIQLASPGALASIRNQLQPERLDRVGTVQDRVADYDATKPDLRTHPALGRGYGTYDAKKYRLLDNQYLGIQIGMGNIGLATYLAIWMAIIGVADYAIRARNRRWASPALAAAGAALAFGVSSALFDLMAFPHVPYMMLLTAAMAVVASRRARDADAAAAAPRPVVVRPAQAGVRPPEPSPVG